MAPTHPPAAAEVLGRHPRICCLCPAPARPRGSRSATRVPRPDETFKRIPEAGNGEGEAAVLGACCPLGIAAQVPGTERRPGFASTGFPVSFAGLECSCGAAGLGTGAVAPGTAGTPHGDTGTAAKPQFGSLGGGHRGDIVEGRIHPTLVSRTAVTGMGRAGDSGLGGARGGIVAVGRALVAAVTAVTAERGAARAWPHPRAINSWHRSLGQSSSGDSPGSCGTGTPGQGLSGGCSAPKPPLSAVPALSPSRE